MLRKLFNSNLSMLMFLLLPVGVVLAYSDYQNRLLESNPEVYGSLYETPKSKRLTKILPDQQQALAENLYFEARGEGYNGMVAVANVVNNRVKDPNFPKTHLEVIYQPKQFSWTNGREPLVIDDEKSWNTALIIANKALNNELPDLSKGARFYANVKNVDTKRHKWVKNYVVLTKIGNHTFMDQPEYVEKHNLLPVKNSNTTKPKNKNVKGT
jgi:hypothetical protein